MGNIWKLVHGLNENIDKNGIFHGFICSDFNFSENKGSDNYRDIGFTFSTMAGYISAFGYSAECDWLFAASETQNSSTAVIGDYYWCKSTSFNEWRQALIGGSWFNGTNAGGFCLSLEIISGYRHRYFGSRLIYVPKSKKL